ncbi:MAG TPA: ABC transporter permease [Puia sp.]|nr:ABC transporter permease [Puia sp.]
MLKKYFVTTVRHLWRFRLFTALNIFGMAVSISACWIIFRIADYEFSYDRHLPHKEKIYRVVSGYKFDEKESYNGGVSAPIYQVARKEMEGVDHVVPATVIYVTAAEVNDSKNKPVLFNDPTSIVVTDTSYFAMLPYHWLAGNKLTAFNSPENVVLTESRAQKYFPGKKPEDIINRTLTYYSWDTLRRTVAGIVSDLREPTEFTAKEFCALQTKPYELVEWTNTNGDDKLYLQLKDGAKPEQILTQITNIVSQKEREYYAKTPKQFIFDRWFQLMALKDSHFSTYIEEYAVRKASKPVLYGLIGIGLFLLILACINYINMSIAGMPQRAKEIGVRKTLGSSHAQLIFQFLSETLFTTFLAAIFAQALGWLGFRLLKDIIPPGVTPLGESLQLVAFVVAVSVVISLLAGIYPGWLIAKVKTVNVFRNSSVVKNNQKFSLQKALIVFQFAIALVFITSALIVGNQLQYVLATDMGFNKDAVVLVDIPWKYLENKNYKDKQFTLYEEFKKLSGVQNVSLGSPPMSEAYSSSQYDYDRQGKEPISRQVFKKKVDTAYLSLYGIKLLAGRNLYPSDTTNELVINETAMHAFGFASPADAIGKYIGQKNQKYPIVGVVKDFHLQNFYKTIDPMALESQKDNLYTFNIKLASRDPSQWQAALKSIEKKWYQFYPAESFSYKFYDEELENMYVQERHLSKLINLATSIAIFISCLGLFGLAVLTAFQRTKEIGIRKVLGASVLGIVQLLSKEYLLLVLIAMLIAAPVSWWVMNKWLQDFAYRIPIEWWMFVLAGIIALVIALLTVSFHALKAAKANPVKSLRTE